MLGELLVSALLGLTQVFGSNIQTAEVAFAKPPITIHVGDIDDEMAANFDAQVRLANTTGQTVIPVVIDSYGGSVYSLLRMIDTINASKVPIATIVEGKAMSAGAVLFSCGAEGMRFIAPNATIMIHEVSGGAGGKLMEMVASVEEAKRLNDLIFKIMAENIGKDPVQFAKILDRKKHANWFLTAKEAKALNLANHIKSPRLYVNIKVDTVLK